jgi:hypothetical protein
MWRSRHFPRWRARTRRATSRCHQRSRIVSSWLVRCSTFARVPRSDVPGSLALESNSRRDPKSQPFSGIDKNRLLCESGWARAGRFVQCGRRAGHKRDRRVPETRRVWNRPIEESLSARRLSYGFRCVSSEQVQPIQELREQTEEPKPPLLKRPRPRL